MATTSPDNIWIPDSDTPMVLDTMFSTLASSIQNGIGARVKKLESFVGCNVTNSMATDVPSLTTSVELSGLAATGTGAFARGVAVSNGNIIIEVAGIYTVSAACSMVRQAAGTNIANCSLFLFRNSGFITYSDSPADQAHGGARTLFCSTTTELYVGDTISIRVRSNGYAQRVGAGINTNISLALTSRS